MDVKIILSLYTAHTQRCDQIGCEHNLNWIKIIWINTGIENWINIEPIQAE